MRSIRCAPKLIAVVACLGLLTGPVLADSDHGQSDEITLDWRHIHVTSQDGPDFSLKIEPDATVGDLRQAIYELEGILSDRITLKMGDTQMVATSKLADYSIQSGTSITLITTNDHDQEVIEFFLKTREGQKVPIVTQAGNLVSSLKDKIAQLTGIASAQQRLLLQGRELRGDRKLVSYTIGNGTTIDLGASIRECDRDARVFVKTLSGATVDVDVNLADTVDDLKERIWKLVRVPAGVQRLFIYKRLIAGGDHLCDLGLEANSTVYMSLHSARITSLDQVAKLQEPPISSSANNYNAPIFREAQDAGGLMQNGARRPAFLYKDTRNWITWYDPRVTWLAELFHPTAHIEPNPDDEQWIQSDRELLEWLLRQDPIESHRSEAEIVLAKIKLSSAVRPYRLAANLTSGSYDRRHPGITLGGGFEAVSLTTQQMPLGANINNWAPDAFSDEDIMRLFEVSERVRHVLAKSAQTGEGLLSTISQRRINSAILSTYIDALAGYRTSVEPKQLIEDGECGICRDDLTAEPAIVLPCEHIYHADCVVSWLDDSRKRERAPSCPSCRQRFMLPYEAVGRAELETPELKINADE